ncbi:MAG: DUF1801 domain-containing protein [Crocinitomicaceae bacterium]|nr:DUF1801 domain-containing protein [Crocinitomicaceae bacterium]MDP4868291.1 DUF1801 domain-containing protein [Crocinitomicaceae bacterium]
MSSIQEILANIPEERKEAFNKLHQTIVDNLPKGFEPGISYGMLGYVIPHELYPAGYHCKPSEPLPFASLASQKNSINFYHMGIYLDSALMEWFVAEFPKHSSQKLDMGKSCIRFKKWDQIPFELMGQLMQKMTAAQWITLYERNLKK